MRPVPFLPLVLAIAFGLPACKVVKTQSQVTPDATAAPQTPAVDSITQLAADSFASRLMPLIAQNAISVADLRAAVAGSLDAAGAAHGNRGAGAGAAWNFAVKGQGTVTAANLTSRARKADLDTDGDGVAELTLLLGPVINGTSLRDVAPFFDFGDLRDQIEFAQLARALNDLASTKLILPAGDLTGKTLSFQGVVPLKNADDAWSVTAASVTVLP